MKLASIALAGLLASHAGALTAAEETTFLSGPDLAGRLERNVVRIESRDLGEHGFGLVVGTGAGQAWIATARHVVARRPRAGLEGSERPSTDIAVGFCATPALAARLQAAEWVAGFDGESSDLALLRTALPPGFVLEPRALAPPESVALGEASWLIGREGQCSVVPTAGTVGELPDALHNLRIDLHGVLGGSSGAPVATGFGLVGLVKRSDNEAIQAHAIDDLLRRVSALPGLSSRLAPARNIPPTDPRAAAIDLTEMLNLYLFGARDLQALLSQPVVPRPTFAALVGQYDQAVTRFRNARDKYDGALQRDWADGLLAEWRVLRERLWKIHLVFFGLNTGSSKTIAETERSPATVRAQMAALEPDLATLQAGIADFGTHLAERRLDRAASPTR